MPQHFLSKIFKKKHISVSVTQDSSHPNEKVTQKTTTSKKKTRKPTTRSSTSSRYISTTPITYESINWAEFKTAPLLTPAPGSGFCTLCAGSRILYTEDCPRCNYQKPPPATSLPSEKKRPSPPPHQEITAKSSPQWEWTTPECQLWLLAVFTQTLGLSRQDAIRAVRQFRGFGPNLFFNTYYDWTRILGNKTSARGFYALVVEGRDAVGGVPRDEYISHGRGRMRGWKGGIGGCRE